MSKIAPVDGRRQRSEKSKQAILEACIHLMKEGVLVPTAQLVADTAGLPIRSFFRHFPDMESLFYAVDAELRKEYTNIYIQEIPKGSLEERVVAAIELRTKSYETFRPIFQSTKAQLWRYKVLQNSYADSQKKLRADFKKRVPEVASLNRDDREMVDALISYELWARFRDHQKMSKTKTLKLVIQSVMAILKNT